MLSFILPPSAPGVFLDKLYFTCIYKQRYCRTNPVASNESETSWPGEGMNINRIQKETLGKFFVDMSKIVLTIFVISGLVPAAKIPLIFVFSGLLTGIILLIIGITILKGAE